MLKIDQIIRLLDYVAWRRSPIQFFDTYQISDKSIHLKVKLCLYLLNQDRDGSEVAKIRYIRPTASIIYIIV